MKIRKLSWRAYRIPFRQAFVTSGGSQAIREGLIVRIDSDNRLFGLGEIAPLRTGMLPTIAALLRTIERRIVDIEADDAARAASSLDTRSEIAAAIRCGLDTASCDLQAKERGIPVAQLLGGYARGPVPVNATIAAATPALAANAAGRAVEQGIRCVKLKVGMMSGIAAEYELVGAVRQAIGRDTLLRLDANQAWDRDTAVQYIRALESFSLEYVEQPVAASDVEGLARVRSLVRVPIAADEAVTGWDAANAIARSGAADLLVIKPIVLGGVRPAKQIIDLAARHSLESVVTTTLDSGVGIAAALHLAAAAGGRRACGLATAELLESTLTSNTPQPHGGMMPCPGGPGLGVEIDEAYAAPYLDRP